MKTREYNHVVIRRTFRASTYIKRDLSTGLIAMLNQ